MAHSAITSMSASLPSRRSERTQWSPFPQAHTPLAQNLQFLLTREPHIYTEVHKRFTIWNKRNNISHTSRFEISVQLFSYSLGSGKAKKLEYIPMILNHKGRKTLLPKAAFLSLPRGSNSAVWPHYSISSLWADYDCRSCWQLVRHPILPGMPPLLPMLLVNPRQIHSSQPSCTLLPLLCPENISMSLACLLLFLYNQPTSGSTSAFLARSFLLTQLGTWT